MKTQPNKSYAYLVRIGGAWRQVATVSGDNLKMIVKHHDNRGDRAGVNYKLVEMV